MRDPFHVAPRDTDPADTRNQLNNCVLGYLSLALTTRSEAVRFLSLELARDLLKLAESTPRARS